MWETMPKSPKMIYVRKRFLWNYLQFMDIFCDVRKTANIAI